MESTQNKLYEIEESAFVDQNNLKNNIIDEDLIGEENKNGIDKAVSLTTYIYRLRCLCGSVR